MHADTADAVEHLLGCRVWVCAGIAVKLVVHKRFCGGPRFGRRPRSGPSRWVSAGNGRRPCVLVWCPAFKDGNL